eukprot:scaffold144845_cov157-Phaeocystis_antarctica.AAC.2
MHHQRGIRSARCARSCTAPSRQHAAAAPLVYWHTVVELRKFYSFDTVDMSRPPPRHLTTPQPLTALTMLHSLTRILGGPRPQGPRRLTESTSVPSVKLNSPKEQRCRVARTR